MLTSFVFFWSLGGFDSVPLVWPGPTGGPSTSAPSTIPSSASGSCPQPIAAVYSDATTGPSDGDDTGALVAILKGDTKWNFNVITVGPNGSMSVQAALAMPCVKLYGQPGASGNDTTAYATQKGDTTAIQNFVKNGGRYLGICMGCFLAEPDHYNIFPGDMEDYDDKYGLSYNSTLLPITWGGQVRQMVFQDGCYITVNPGATGVQVLAKFSTGEDAAVVAPYGQGKTCVSGPHPEAPASWLSGNTSGYVGPLQNLANNLIDTCMQ